MVKCLYLLYLYNIYNISPHSIVVYILCNNIYYIYNSMLYMCQIGVVVAVHNCGALVQCSKWGLARMVLHVHTYVVRYVGA
jgi:hypothetical protein